MGRPTTLELIAREAEALAPSIAAVELLRHIGPDPDADTHRAELLRAMGWQCHITGCPRQSRSCGLCDTHYRALRNLPRKALAS